MNESAEFLHASEAAKRLGVSVKALRIYEQHGLIEPVRTSAGWRAYGPAEMTRGAEIAALRALGLSLAHIARVLRGDADGLERILATHQTSVECRIRQLTDAIDKIRILRTSLVQGRMPKIGERARLAQPVNAVGVAFDLPWPWGGERFELRDVKPINYIVGPLGSGKTRLSIAIAENIPGAAFIGLERSRTGSAQICSRTERDTRLKSRIDSVLTWLTEDGAQISPALIALISALEKDTATTLVVDMVEQGLNQATQEALIAYLRQRGPNAPTLFLLTRSNAILDLTAIGPEEAIILCPANHSPPTRVATYQGAPGFEAVATCLASPDVRARTEGMIAMRPKVA